MKDFSKATPRPWIIVDGFIYQDSQEHEGIGQLHFCYVKDDNSLGYSDCDNAGPNAELIVTAVNNFERMKEALEKHLAILRVLTDAGIIEKHENGKDSIIDETEQLLESIK